jgi:hypothetical protein
MKNPELYKLKDTVKYSDFQIEYKDKHSSDHYSSIDSIYIRYAAGVNYASLPLTVDEKKYLYRTIKVNDFYSLPDTINDYRNAEVDTALFEEITFIVGSNRKTVLYFKNWDKSKKDYNEVETRIFRIYKVIEDLIFNKPTIKSLPKGYYD